MRLGLPVGVVELSLLRRSYDRCVTVELLPLDRSVLAVKPESTDRRDGFVFLELPSLRRCTPPVRCFAGRRYIEFVSSRWRWRFAGLFSLCLLVSEPLVLGREPVGSSLASSIRLNPGIKRMSSPRLPRSLVWLRLEYGDLLGSSRRDEFRFEDRLRLGGDSSMSVHSDELDRPCSRETGEGPAGRLLLLFAASSVGLETTSLGGTGGEASPAVSDCESHRIR